MPGSAPTGKKAMEVFSALSTLSDQPLSVAGDHQLFVGGNHPGRHPATVGADTVACSPTPALKTIASRPPRAALSSCLQTLGSSQSVGHDLDHCPTLQSTSLEYNHFLSCFRFYHKLYSRVFPKNGFCRRGIPFRRMVSRTCFWIVSIVGKLLIGAANETCGCFENPFCFADRASN